MSPEYKKFIAVLKASNNSLTAARRELFNLLSTSEPLTINEIITTLESTIDRASIYRNVSLFEELNISKRLSIGWKYKIELSDEYSHHHHHFTCNDCLQTMVLGDDPILEQNINSLIKNEGLTMTEHQLEIRGLCKSCQLNHA